MIISKFIAAVKLFYHSQSDIRDNHIIYVFLFNFPEIFLNHSTLISASEHVKSLVL